MTNPSSIDIAHIRNCLKPLDERTGLLAEGTRRHSDFDLSGRFRDGPDNSNSQNDISDHAHRGQTSESTSAAALREAAVLVPLIARKNGYQVLLTQRTDHLNHHAGQISFPGGRLDPNDENHLATALRESHEEVGLEAKFVEPLGLLDDYETGTSFLVTPVVALVHPGFTLELEAFEVAEAFEVPLRFLFDDRNHQIQSRMRNGERRHYYVFEFKQRYIWGATAGMLMNFYRRVHGLPAPRLAREDLTTGSR